MATFSDIPREEFEARTKELERAFPNYDDPRRDPSFGTRTPESEANKLLGAILTELYNIGWKLHYLDEFLKGR